MFLVNSRLGLFTAATSPWLPFSLSYGVILQSSLTRVIPFVLGFSPRLPVSVCGTGTIFLPSNFSRQREFISFLAIAKCPRSPASRDAYLTTSQPRSKTSLFHPWGLTILLCHCIGKNVRWWYRNINLLVIIYGFRPRLRSRLTMGGRTFPIKP